MTVSPPRPKGPPLNALRAFEAAARLGGFAAAADELCVTSGAVAQHIKALEAWAGADLFERRSQGVKLTSLGAGVLADFSAAFDQLGQAVQTLRARAEPAHIRIAALPSIAQLWLSPLLPAIRGRNPGLSISVTATETPPNLRREPFDLSIFYEDAAPASNSVRLCPDIIFPVCAPALAARLKTPADLAGMTFLQDATWNNDWDHWFSEVLPDTEIQTQGPTFSLYALAVEEAKNNAGILMGHEALLRPLLKSGELVAPFDLPVKLNRYLSIRLARPEVPNSAISKLVKALRG